MRILNMCISQNFLFNNTGLFGTGSTLGNYQYGMNIADLFTGVQGLNTVWNFNNCGYSNYGGYNCNNALGFTLGMTTVNILGTLGMCWINSSRTKKAEEAAEQKATAAKEEKTLKNAVTTINPESGASITLDEVKNVSSKNKDDLIGEVNNLEYSKATELVNTKRSVETKQTTVENSKTALSKCESDVTNAEKAYNDAMENNNYDINNEAVKQAKEACEKAKTALNEAQKDLSNAEKALKDEKAKLAKLEQEEKQFDEAKQTVLEAIDKNVLDNDAKIRAEEAKIKAEEAEKLDKADGNCCNRRADKNAKYTVKDGMLKANEQKYVQIPLSSGKYYKDGKEVTISKQTKVYYGTNNNNEPVFFESTDNIPTGVTPVKDNKNSQELAQSMDDRDLRGLINDYRNGDNATKQAIAEFVKNNYDYIGCTDATIMAGLDIIKKQANQAQQAS